MSTKTARTFAGQLRHFARSVDIVDDNIFDRVRELVYKYVRNELGAEYFEVLREQPTEDEPALKMFWSSEDSDHFWRIRGSDGSFTNPITQAFAQNQCLWVVGNDRKPLRQAEKLEDEWSGTINLSRYQPVVDKGIRTLVAVPLHRRPHSIYYFESCAHLGITEVAKSELQILGDALSILLELFEHSRMQSNMTGSAIFELQEHLESAKFPKLAQPHFFVAFSNRADKAVITIVHEVLRHFSDRLEFTDWTRMSESGNISAQITREITRSRFGICYFSEPGAEDAHTSYTDNPNVVFEAGMLHALTAVNESGDGGEPTGWIPLREVNSPPAPFDFAAERTLHIPRFEDGALQEERLRDRLTERVQRLLEEE